MVLWSNVCALDGDTKEHYENRILSLDNVTMFLQNNQLNKSSFSNDIYIFLPGIVFSGHPVYCIFKSLIDTDMIYIILALMCHK